MDALRHENCHDRDHGGEAGGGNEGLQATNLGNCARKLTLGVTTTCHVMARTNVQAAKDSRCKRKLRLGDRRNFTP